MCFSPDLYCRRGETDEEAPGGERDGAADRQKSSVHLHWISVDQRTGNYCWRHIKTPGWNQHKNHQHILYITYCLWSRCNSWHISKWWWCFFFHLVIHKNIHEYIKLSIKYIMWEAEMKVHDVPEFRWAAGAFWMMWSCLVRLRVYGRASCSVRLWRC